MKGGGDRDPHRDRRASARAGVVDPEGALSPLAPPPAPRGAGGRRFSLRPSVEPFAASDGNLYLLEGGAAAKHVIRDATAHELALFAALDGPPATAGEIAGRMGVAPQSLDAALDQLAALGLLRESATDGGLDARVSERFDRQLAWLEDRLGDGREVVAAQRRLAAARVCVLGCGGLGTWTAAALACVGVGCLVLVDDDSVELSNLNRQILFGAADVGRPKVAAAAAALRRLDPSLEVVTRAERLRGEAAVAAAIAGCDLVVEAADWPMYELPRWVDAACRRHGTPHISAAQHPPVVQGRPAARAGPVAVPALRRGARARALPARRRGRRVPQRARPAGADARPRLRADRDARGHRDPPRADGRAPAGDPQPLARVPARHVREPARARAGRCRARTRRAAGSANVGPRHASRARCTTFVSRSSSTSRRSRPSRSWPRRATSARPADASARSTAGAG